MNTKSTDDIDLEQWLAEMPAPPTTILARLKAAKVRAYWLDRRHAAPGSGDLIIESSFTKLPLVKKILIKSGVKRSKWPHRRPWQQNERYKLRLIVKYTPVGPAASSVVPLKLTVKQRLKLEQYAQSLCQPPKMAAQALFNDALNKVFLAQLPAADENPSSAGFSE
jgi:hypothetical protein